MQQLAGADQALDDFSAYRREHGNLQKWFSEALHQRFGVGDAQGAQSVGAGFTIRLRLRAVGFGLLQIALGDGFVLEQIFARVDSFCRRAECVVRFQVGGAGRRIIWAIDREKRLPGVTFRRA